MQNFLMQHTYEIDTRKTILIVEDHPAIRDLLVFTFTLSGYRVVAVESLSSSMWITDSVHIYPDGIVLDIDIRSTTLNGLSDILHTFCTCWQHAFINMQRPPLLLITTQPANQRRFEQEGYLVMTKPFRPPNLIECMNKIVEQYAKNSFEAGR